MRKFSIFILALLIVVFVTSLSYGEVGTKINAKDNGAATTLDYASGDLLTTDGSNFLVGTRNVSAEITTPVTVIPLTYRVVPVTVTSRTVTIAAGTPGQVITITGVNQTGTLTITGTSKTITMDANYETVTLLWLDNMNCWIVIDSQGASVS